MAKFDTRYNLDLSEVKVFCRSCKTVQICGLSELGKPHQCSRCNEYFIVPRERFAPGVTIADYVIEELIGSGGCGSVFRAWQISLDRPCALKILHERVLTSDAELHELTKEGRLAGRLNHPSIVQCYAIGEEDSVFYYAMELIDGKSLKQILSKRWRLQPSRAIDIVIQIADALEYAWSRERLVHRDIKPDNIMIDHDGFAKLTDMGLALTAHALHQAADTENDEIQGSPHYLSPEQIMGQPQDLRSDIYSLGIVLYQCLSGGFPFNGDSPQELLMHHLDTVVPDLRDSNPDLPPALTRLICRMMAKSPAERPGDYAQLKRELVIIRNGLSDSSKNGGLAALLQTQSGSTSAYPVAVAKPLILQTQRQTADPAGGEAVKSHRFIPKAEAEEKKPRSSLPYILVGVAIVLLLPILISSLKSAPVVPAVIAPPSKAASAKFLSAMIDPAGYDPGHEWIEINGLGACTLVNAEGLQFSLKPTSSGRIELSPDFLLNNEGERLELRNDKGAVLDHWAIPAAQIHAGEVTRR
jgi:serine/threonine protein kinase